MMSPSFGKMEGDTTSAIPADQTRDSSDALRRISTSPSSPSTTTIRPRIWGSDMQSPLSLGQTPDVMSPWSASSEKQFGCSSPGPQDRVFPVRSVVSVDPTQTPFLPPGHASGEHEGFPGL